MKAGCSICVPRESLKIEIASDVLHILNGPECHADRNGKGAFVQIMEPAQGLDTL
jgi:hypothetical protein